MPTANIGGWIRIGLLALPVYGLLTFWATLESQPDQTKNPEAWARFVSSTAHLLTHLFGSIGGAILAILGVFALGAYLARSRAGGMGLAAMVMAVVGHALFLSVVGLSAFATPAIARAYLAGMQNVMRLQFGSAQTATFGLGILLLLVGNVLLGVAVWRSGTLPKWAGAIWAASALMFYVLGAVLAMATTGSSLLTQPLAAVLMVVSGGWIAWSVLRQPSAEAVRVAAQPRVR
jgi:O-antigen/teichoic acid export membrane protein